MSADQVLDIELSHIRNCSLRQMQSNAAVAAKYGLKLFAYEGGQHLVGIMGAENNTALTAVFKAANRSPRMRTLYAEYLQNWKSVGGDLFVHYSDVCAYSKWGNWGALAVQDQTPSSAPKYQALSDFAAQSQTPQPDNGRTKAWRAKTGPLRPPAGASPSPKSKYYNHGQRFKLGTSPPIIIETLRA